MFHQVAGTDGAKNNDDSDNGKHKISKPLGSASSNADDGGPSLIGTTAFKH